MKDSVFSLIQENRRLFYTGVLRNQYKTQDHSSRNNSVSGSESSQSNQKEKYQSIKSKSIHILQELFNE